MVLRYVLLLNKEVKEEDGSNKVEYQFINAWSTRLEAFVVALYGEIPWCTVVEQEYRDNNWHDNRLMLIVDRRKELINERHRREDNSNP